MSSRSFLKSLFPILLVAFIGCDGNPGGPSVQEGPPPDPNAKPAEKTKLPKSKRTVEGAPAVKAD